MMITKLFYDLLSARLADNGYTLMPVANQTNYFVIRNESDVLICLVQVDVEDVGFSPAPGGRSVDVRNAFIETLMSFGLNLDYITAG